MRDIATHYRVGRGVKTRMSANSERLSGERRQVGLDVHISAATALAWQYLPA